MIADTLMSLGVTLAERGVVPDAPIRSVMRRVIASRLASLEGSGDAWLEPAWSGPIAESTDSANSQHYEVPPEFFSLVLGPRLKYSCGYWPEGVDDLAGSEEAMLGIYAERAGLSDGQTVLDLGCGWGSFSLWGAERYPDSEFVAVSNSRAQAEFIEKRAADLGLVNLRVHTADINNFEPGRRFDRIVSVEMLEHVRNHRVLLSRIAGWMDHDSLLFTHVFAHWRHAYAYETDGAANWMAQNFFTGGVMPSPWLLPKAGQPHLELVGEWWLPGDHYATTCEAWLERLDSLRDEAEAVLIPECGARGAAIAVQRWRMFFMACAEMFAYEGGTQWGVSHQAFTLN